MAFRRNADVKPLLLKPQSGIKQTRFRNFCGHTEIFLPESLYNPLFLCYNTPDATGKQVKILYEPVAVSRTPPPEATSGLTPCRKGKTVIGTPYRSSEKADLTAPSRNTRASCGQKPAEHFRKRREGRQEGKTQ